MPRILTLAAALLLGLSGLLRAQQMQPFEVMDRQGFEAPMVAYRMEVPAGWTARGQILWQKPCSGNEFYELVLTVTSPDGLTGFRVMPGHQVIWTDIVPTASAPGLAQMMAAQMAADRARMETQFRGSNCHVGQITGGTDQFLKALILSDRPRGTTVTGITQNEHVLASYRSLFGPDLPGMRTLFDAVEARLRYPSGQTTVEETLWLSWYLFQADPTELNGGFFSQTAIVDPIRLVWRPVDRAATDDPLLSRIAASITVDKAWQERILDFQDRILSQRRQQREEDAARREQDRIQREMQSDAMHQQFIDMIRQ